VDKAPDAFRTISEVAEELDIPQHVLRFWESRFREIKPMKRGGGRRYYRPDDVDLLRGIRHLLYGEGYTIRGVQRILREEGLKFVQSVWQPGALKPAHGPADDTDAVLEDAEQESDTPAAERKPGLFGMLPSILAADANSEPPERTERKPLSTPGTPRSQSSQHAAPSASAPPSPTAAAAKGLAREDLRKLQAALQELGECRKLLDAALQQNA
jgi:DNA-binding transcriptional MerR regulator